jgi:glycolate oxidase
MLGEGRVLVGDEISSDYSHDESLGLEHMAPQCLIFVQSAKECSALLALANELSVPIIARGSGSGLSGGAIPVADGVLLSFEKMDRIIEIDTLNHTATLEAGVTLLKLAQALAEVGFVYPVYPGELSASIGGNVATNAGGMRAVKYGVTRHNVLGIQFVTATGAVIESGGKFVKSSTGYDLSQLIIGSEGTLSLVTKVIVAITPTPNTSTTLVVPFDSVAAISNAIPEVLRSNFTPSILEYVDAMGLSVMASREGINLGIPKQIQDEAQAYLICMLEEADQENLERQQIRISNQLIEAGALDVFELTPSQALRLLAAREAAFWVTKELGATEIVDIVVPRSQVPTFMEKVGEIGDRYVTSITAVGHAGDGNIHLSVFEKDPATKDRLMSDLYAVGMELGGEISAEHGIGTAKRKYFLEHSDPAKVELMREIKRAFDPKGILNPGKVF